MEELKHKTELVVGDWSCDGHEKQDNILIVSNLTSEEIARAYQKGVKVVGFDLTEEVAVDYEDSSLSEEQQKMLLKANCPLEEISFNYRYAKEHPEVGGDWASFSGGEFAELYLWFVEQGNPNFKFEYVAPNVPRLNVGGYGCYH